MTLTFTPLVMKLNEEAFSYSLHRSRFRSVFTASRLVSIVVRNFCFLPSPPRSHADLKRRAFSPKKSIASRPISAVHVSTSGTRIVALLTAQKSCEPVTGSPFFRNFGWC
ncbi:hypothetical protein Zmor_008037 [Zophobas morio]|uniref:Uncharacterized protein n=1 Tax=Zophobas morio TaxID=2755281 RepID=A0AA38IZG2_9CUCU|nr:hypothetical protein Zmor_008037 [Zophobas morio]